MNQTDTDSFAAELPATAQVVIIGGGVIGCSVAYHLTKRGWTDVVLLERDELGCGSSWHAHGLVGLLRAGPNLTRLAMCTNDVLKQLEAETGLSTGFKQSGSLIVTADRDHLEQLQRMSSSVRRVGLDLERISVGEAGRIWPLIKTKDLVGAFFMSAEGQTNSFDTNLAYAKGARMGGARILEHTKVIAVHRNQGRVVGVTTENGPIEAEYVVNCAGLWGWEVGQLSGVSVPVLALESSYAVTEPIAELSANMPMLRDFHAGIGVREDSRQLTIGIPPPKARPWGTRGIPEGFSFDELPSDPEQFEVMFERILHRIPALEHVGIRKFLTGPDPYSPDSLLFLGEAPELRNYFVASGMSGVGIGSSGGIGRELAGWIIDGRPSMDLWEVDIRRFMPFQGSRRYQHARISEGGSALFEVFWPYHQPKAARNTRQSPLHHRLAAAGAHFDTDAGWEVPRWYVSSGRDTGHAKSYQRQPWFEFAAAEHLAPAQGIGLSDLSSDTKLQVNGGNAAAALGRICANDIAVNPGIVIHTPMLNRHGGIEAYVEVHRIAEDQFMIFAAASFQTKLRHWLERNMNVGTGVSITDVTGAISAIGLLGARSRNLLESIGAGGVADDEFTRNTFKELDIGYTRARVTRNDCSDIPVWEIRVPAEFATSLYDTLVVAGRELGIRHVGADARQSLLLESGVVHRGDIYSALDTPLEVGLEHLLAWEKSRGFIGDAALTRQQEQGVRKCLTRFVLEASGPLLFGNEPIFRDGEETGHVLKGSYGHRVGAAIALGYIKSSDPLTTEFISSGNYEIEVGGRREVAHVLAMTAG